MENKKIANYFAIAFSVLIFLILIKAFDISYPVTITNISKSTELSVVGEGKLDVVPDTAYIEAGITINNVATTELAQTYIDKTNNKIIEEMKKLGIKKENIKTTNYSISPNYKYNGYDNTIDGYNGNATVEIKVKDTQLLARVISAATASGANQIQSSRFVVSSAEKYREQVRDTAIKNARDQAEKLAKKLGIKLGRVTNIIESPVGQTVDYNYKLMTANGAIGGAGDSSASIEPGSQTITSVVTLFFEKK